ncbi:hypothetical protein M1L60_19415 [Actinoplanes sp. TRM 88003]|uniref:Secreted protein n=1 Tax=Paractinoplanes aksuensis TaxID=2939490 RepID=A0ABT1DPJ1_9ACTN|nr:hypothetical protein [Actinoplanes aksuensis]MCO8272767.1 hypothetical protein [Actinoplanes aksuensis]
MTKNRILIRVAAALSATLLFVLASVNPAQAAPGQTAQQCVFLAGGNDNNDDELFLCAGVRRVNSTTIDGISTVRAGGKFVTSAKRCRVTMYLDLKRASVWTTTKTVQNCDNALLVRNLDVERTHWTTATTAIEFRAHVCVDFYYGTSTSSGYQGCRPVGENSAFMLIPFA